MAPGLTGLAGWAFAGKMESLVGDWDLDIENSKFEPREPMKKYTMKVINAGKGRLLTHAQLAPAPASGGGTRSACTGTRIKRPLAPENLCDTGEACAVVQLFQTQ